MKLFSVLAVVITLAGGCMAPEQTGAKGNDTSEFYEGVGQYLFHSTENSQTTVNINHEEIEGFMGAMAMPYLVKDDSLVNDLEAGQDITFRVVVEDGGLYFIDRITRLEPGETPNES